MAIYRPHEVNCGHYNEPTGIPVDDWVGEPVPKAATMSPPLIPVCAVRFTPTAP
jgi:hypothetical protein